jgi:signal transduction histidine kinase
VSEGLNGQALRALSDAILETASELRLQPALQRLVDAARTLAGARYAALGVPDGDGGFADFITSGMSEAQLDALGELPKTHGLLGAMLESPEPYRTLDIRADPRFEGWPDAHPVMQSFLGVPIVSHGEVIGAFYLTEKHGERHGSFDDHDVELIRLLAAHAAITIVNARLYEESRELSVVEERKRLARELHDSVTQTLLGLIVTADAARVAHARDPDATEDRIAQVAELGRSALDEMRSLVFELRPASLEAHGLAVTLERHADVLRRVHGVEIEVVCGNGLALDPDCEREVFRIAQEALTNAVKHAGPGRVVVSVTQRGSGVVLVVADDGCGFEPDEARLRSGRLGLTSMRERAELLGGSLAIESSPAAGTRVVLEV